MIKKIILTVLLLFLSSISYGQDGHEKIIKYVHDDLLKEHPEFDWCLSDFSPRIFKANLTGDEHQDLIVEWNRYKAGGAIYVFKLDNNKAKLVLKKESYEVSSKPVSWGNHNGLLVALGDDEGGEVSSKANIFVYKKNQFVSVLQYPYSSYVIHGGYLLVTQLISLEDKLLIVRYEMDGVMAKCAEVSLFKYRWDDFKFKFNKTHESELSGKSLDEFLMKYNTQKTHGIPPVCDPSDPG